MQKHMFSQKMGPPMGPPAPRTVTTDDSESKVHCLPVAWDKYFDEMRDVALGDGYVRIYLAGTEGPLLILFHGGGHSSLSWALVAAELKAKCRVLAYDYRGHGSTKLPDEEDLSLGTLANDAILLVKALYPEGEADPPKILVGHSLGGAVATQVALSNQLSRVEGLVVLDVVEGTAMASLRYMRMYLEKVPASFPSMEKAIEWSVRSKTTRKKKSARVSVPPRLVYKEEGQRWIWRTDLAKTEQFWSGWYEGLSKKFLSCRAIKVLILAGRDRMDTELTIAQMQGKFKLVILPDVGHCLQEDDPKKTAEVLQELAKRLG